MRQGRERLKRPLPLWVPGALLALGLLQMTADVAGWRSVKGMAAATLLSPAPRVFSTAQGLETFSIQIELHWRDARGAPQSLELTPEVAAKLQGPYNRRNVYGAVLAYGPVLLESEAGRLLFEAVLTFALQGERPLLRELGLDPAQVSAPLRLTWTPLHGGENLTREYLIP